MDDNFKRDFKHSFPHKASPVSKKTMIKQLQITLKGLSELAQTLHVLLSDFVPFAHKKQVFGYVG